MEILQIGVIGAFASVVLETIKSKWPLTSTKSKLSIIGLSVLFGGAYYFLKDTNIWVSILGVLGAATTVYNFFIKS